MPGAGGRFERIDKPPLCWSILARITMTEFAAGCLLRMTPPKWAQAIPDTVHPRGAGDEAWTLSFWDGI
jgi:hypothetical protein